MISVEFKELSRDRQAFFNERLKGNPELAPLRDKLLEVGGLEIVPRFEEDLSKLIERGETWDFPVEMEIMDVSRCHQNSAELWSVNPEINKLVTGWALNDDGLWRQHTWIVNDNSIIETTEERLKYFGFMMTEEEAEEFYFNNCWGQPKFLS